MPRKFQIQLEDGLFHQLNKLCNGDESIMQDYIVHTLREKFDQSNDKKSSGKKDNLEDYLIKGQSGSRNYGIKGQGW